jgi:hypothetical protein
MNSWHFYYDFAINDFAFSVRSLRSFAAKSVRFGEADAQLKPRTNGSNIWPQPRSEIGRAVFRKRAGGTFESYQC